MHLWQYLIKLQVIENTCAFNTIMDINQLDNMNSTLSLYDNYVLELLHFMGVYRVISGITTPAPKYNIKLKNHI